MRSRTIDIYGTLGPACSSREMLEAMFREGMTGVRLNLSHTSLRQAADLIETYREAAANCGITPKLLIDMQGPELRIGRLTEPLTLREGEICTLGDAHAAIPIPEAVRQVLAEGAEILLDDGKILLRTENASDGEMASARVLRGGILTGGKSIAVPGSRIASPAMTEQDLVNIREAGYYGVTGVMQPFVRSREDLKMVKAALTEAGWPEIRLFAKIENLDGVRNLESFFDDADEIVIARGDLGNAMPLWELPPVQAQIAETCRNAGKPFMVVTQMLASMEQNAVPTRAEVSDIYRAVSEGASSVMVTGETATGAYPVEVIRYLSKTAQTALN